MTIAACYVSPEGIVFGADSTASSFSPPYGLHYFNHNQKVFEVGRDSTLGVVTWGLASIGTKALRTLIAEFGDQLEALPAKDMREVADRFGALLSAAYLHSYKANVDRLAFLHAKNAPNPSNIFDGDCRNPSEQKEYITRRVTGTLGFCLGGYLPYGRTPRAFEIIIDPAFGGSAKVDEIPVTKNRFYGAPKIFKRLINGYDDELIAELLGSGKWNGSKDEFIVLLEKHELKHSFLPIREAVDFVFVCIQATIKAMKFSAMPQTCGGPIELAVITSDRNFRWIRHKEWSSAVDEGQRS